MYNVFDVLMLTMVIVLQTPGLDEVLRELGVGEERDIVRDQHHIALGELLQLQVHLADLNQAITSCTLLKLWLPVYQMDNGGASMCNETFCCRSDS